VTTLANDAGDNSTPGGGDASSSDDAPPDTAAAAVEAPRFRNLYDEIDELTKTRMLEALAASDGARAKAAARIGMPLRTFVTKLREHQIKVPLARAKRPPK
jgi:DNA-binding NtrC family response regulator